MTPDFRDILLSPVYWTMVVVTAIVVVLCVSLHYEGLERLNRRIPHWRLPARVRILAMILGILVLHVIEIWIFGISINLMVHWPAFGHIGGTSSRQLLDAIYLSTTTFTTVGYGDLIPNGPIRLLLGSEALTGFVLLTWSASFTYLEMQRYWRTS